MKRFRYLLVSVLGLALVGSVATAAVMSNKNSYNVMAENATISATPAEDVMVEVPTITFVVEHINTWGDVYGLKYHSWNTKTVFDNSLVSEGVNSPFFYEGKSNIGTDPSAYGPIYDLINPKFVDGELRPSGDTSMYRDAFTSPVTYHLPWYVTSLDMQLYFSQGGVYWVGNDYKITEPGTYYFYNCNHTGTSESGNTKYCRWDVSPVLAGPQNLVEVNAQYKQFLTDYFSVVQRNGVDLSICAADVNVVDLRNLLTQYDALSEDVRAEVNKAADSNIIYNDQLSTVEVVMDYLRDYVPSLEKEAELASSLIFNSSSDNSLLIAGVASLGLLSVVGVAYFINQKKKRA